ncbi:MAG TPA: LCP family protein [Solirubrobacterales bacterium]|nr:LCP family protein [Solirubrobacterales bacterium]
MTPPRKGRGRGDEQDPRPDETEEYELDDDFLSDIDEEEEVSEEGLDEIDPEELDDEDREELDEDDYEGEEEYEDEGLDEEDELERVVSAETEEWDGLDAAEAESEADEPTLVASAGQRMKRAGSAITSSFEKVGGRKVTDGFKAVGSEGVKRIRRWRPGFPLWLRFLTASFVIIASIATATSASLILYLGDIASALRHSSIGPEVNKFLSKVDGGGPQTILILGSDKDPELKDVEKGFKGLSDTTMLLRLDPDRGAISLFSLPRDLKVEIPGSGTDKLNAAYAYGGPQLTLQTVETLLSTPEQPFEVNHLVNVDFEGFARAVNAIDCVYVDVDRRYFNSNEGKAAADTYEEIDIQPGYQALCGFDALDYTRYRHTDNDIVRAARQQEFLREARAKIPPQRLISDRKELISIFTEHTSSDINDSQTMLQVLRLFLDSRDKPVKEVRFEGTLGPSFVTATPEELQTAVRQFLGIQGTPGTVGKTAAPDEPVEADVPPDQTAVPPAAPGGEKDKKEPPVKDDGSLSEGVNLTPTSYGKQLAKGIRARGSKIPIFYPTVLQTGSDYAQKPRVYKVNGTGEGSPPRGQRAAYKWVFSRPAIGEYYGFMATRWTDPPILDDPDDERTIKGRDYKFYYENDRLRMVAWQTDAGSFWLSNTLIESLSNNEMLRIAESFRELGGTG